MVINTIGKKNCLTLNHKSVLPIVRFESALLSSILHQKRFLRLMNINTVGNLFIINFQYRKSNFNTSKKTLPCVNWYIDHAYIDFLYWNIVVTAFLIRSNE